MPCVSGSLSGEPRIVPGNPAGSVLYQLIDERGALQMPPIASVLVDVPDVAVVRSWIVAMVDGGAGPVDEDAGFDASGGHHDHDGGEFDASDFDASAHDGGEHDGGGKHDAGSAEDGGVIDTGAPDAGGDAGEDAGEDSAIDASDDAG